MFSLFDVIIFLFNGKIKQIFRARLPVSNISNNRLPRIIALGYYSRKYGIYISADSEQLFLVQNRSTIPSDHDDLLY